MIRRLVSVVLPTRNRAATLPAAMNSVLRQTWSDLELLVVDDASDDPRVADQVMTLAEQDGRVQLLRRTHCGGAAAARNTGLEHARGAYVAFQDDDDQWRPDKLERQMALFDQLGDDCVAVGGTLRRDTAEGWPRLFPWPSVRQDAPWVDHDAVIDAFCVFVQTLVVRRHAATAAGPFDERLRVSEDWEWLLRVMQQGRLAQVDHIIVDSPESVGGLATRPELRPEAYGLILQRHSALLREHPRAEARIRYERGKALALTGHRGEAMGEVLRAWRCAPQQMKMLAALPLMFAGPHATRWVMAAFRQLRQRGAARPRP